MPFGPVERTPFQFRVATRNLCEPSIYAMQDLEKLLFSPLGKHYCLYFYWLTVIAFVFFLTAAASTIYMVVQGEAALLPGLLAMVGPFLLYFNNRLLYGMCSGSLGPG